MRAMMKRKILGTFLIRFIACLAVAIAVIHTQGKIGVGFAQETTAAPAPQRQVAAADTDESRIADLITAYRICVNEGVLDSFGHISVRSVTNPSHFYMPRAAAPALITRADIVELDMSANPVLPNAP